MRPLGLLLFVVLSGHSVTNAQSKTFGGDDEYVQQWVEDRSCSIGISRACEAATKNCISDPNYGAACSTAQRYTTITGSQQNGNTFYCWAHCDLIANLGQRLLPIPAGDRIGRTTYQTESDCQAALRAIQSVTFSPTYVNMQSSCQGSTLTVKVNPANTPLLNGQTYSQNADFADKNVCETVRQAFMHLSRSDYLTQVSQCLDGYNHNYYFLSLAFQFNWLK